MRRRASTSGHRAGFAALGISLALIGADALPAPLTLPDAAVSLPDYLKIDTATFAMILAVGIPQVPSGNGKVLSATSMESVAASASASEGYITARQLPGGGYPGRELRPRNGMISVPLISEPREPVALRGQGALRVDEQAPASIRYRDPTTGVVTEYVTYGKLAEAGSAAGRIDDGAKEGILIGSFASWMALRDADPDDVPEQSALMQVAGGAYYRSAAGPLLSGVTATVSEVGVVGLARGRTQLAPDLTFLLLSTFGLPEAPKRDRDLHAAFVLQGLVSFLPSPLWSLEIEIVPDGSMLTRFTGSEALRDGDHPDQALDANAVLLSLREWLRLDASGVPETPGLIDISDKTLFDAVIDSPRRFNYTQRVITYLDVSIPEPGTALLATSAVILAISVSVRARSRRQAPFRSR